MLLLTFCCIRQNFEAWKVRSHFSAAPVWGDLLRKGLRMPEASKVELRRSTLEGEICVHALFKKGRNWEPKTLVFIQILWDWRQDPSLDLSTKKYGQEFRGTLKPGDDVADKTWKEVDRGMTKGSSPPRGLGAWVPVDPAVQLAWASVGTMLDSIPDQLIGSSQTPTTGFWNFS